MPRRSYDPELRTSEHGRRLYETWKRIRKSEHDASFENYQDFYNWAIANGYSLGDILMRRSASLPYDPKNCYWKASKRDDMSAEWAIDWCEKWNKTVNVLRRYFGLPEI